MGVDAEKGERDGFGKDRKPRGKRNERNYVPVAFPTSPLHSYVPVAFLSESSWAWMRRRVREMGLGRIGSQEGNGMNGTTSPLHSRNERNYVPVAFPMWVHLRETANVMTPGAKLHYIVGN